MVYYDYLNNYLDDDHSNHPQFPGGLALVQAAERGSVEELQRLLSFLLGDRGLTPTRKHREVAVLETNELLQKNMFG